MNPEKPNRIDQSEGSPIPYRRSERPKRQEFKPLQNLDTATNEAREVFKIGELIQVTSPWGGRAIAEITALYKDESENAWAQYTPKESRPDWTWEGGCILAVLLVKAIAITE